MQILILGNPADYVYIIDSTCHFFLPQPLPVVSCPSCRRRSAMRKQPPFAMALNHNHPRSLPAQTFPSLQPSRSTSSPSHSLAFSGQFSSLYMYPLIILYLRFTTRTELILNGLSLIAAVAAGASQVGTWTFFLHRAWQIYRLTHNYRSLS